MTASGFTPDLLAGKVAVVTGGGTGLGRAIALALARHGASVVVASRKREALEAVARQIASGGARSLAVSCDVAEHEQVKSLFADVDREFGRVDILINGAAANFIRPSERLTSLRWRKVIDVVLNGGFSCALEAGRRMIARKEGAIVSLVAAYAWTGAPGLAPSASAKAGLVAMTRSLGAEWARFGVRVNAVCPGLIDTQQSREALWPEPWMRELLLENVPTRRFGVEQDVANAVLFLASPLAAYANGTVLVVDGGESLGKGALKVIEKRPPRSDPSA